MRTFFKKITSPFLKKASVIYFSKPRKYTYKNFAVWVEPTVFPPFFTISTKLLSAFLETLSLEKKKVLELGCGCGIISILAAKNGAIVTATDINKTALEALEKNSNSNQVFIEIIYSDLFENLTAKSFDIIIINPPYYPKTPTTLTENAWYCGENFEYFEQLFKQIPTFLTSSTEAYMILSEDCAIEKIQSIASKNKILLVTLFEKIIIGEKNFLFQLKNE